MVGITGDQSFGEALSLGKFPLYEYFGHKKYMMGGLSIACDQAGFPSLNEVFSHFTLPTSPEAAAKFITAYQTIKLPETQEAYTGCLEYLRANYDLEKALWKTLSDLE